MLVDDYVLTDFDKSLLVHTILNNPYIPVDLYDKQLLSVALVNKDWNGVNEVLTGGSGGGGKTTLLSALAVQYLQVPDYRCLVARKNYKELIGTGSVFDILEDWVTPGNSFDCSVNHSTPIRVKAPSGAEIHFKAFNDERSKQTIKGESYHRIIVDESSEIVPDVLAFMYRSLRKTTTSLLPLSMVHASNPLGPSNQYLIDNYVGENAPYLYIPFSFYDNPFIDSDLYEKSLLKLPKMDREAQLRGNWFYKPNYGYLIDGEDFDRQVVPSMVGSPLINIVSADMASTGDDSTALTSLVYSSNGMVYLADSMTIKDSKTESFVLKFLGEQVEKYNTYLYVLEAEPGSASTYASRYWQDLIYEDYPMVSFTTDRPSKSKFERSRLSASYITHNRLFIVEDSNTERLREEFMYIHPDKKELDKYPSPDMLDSLNQGMFQMDKFIQSTGSGVSLGKVY